MWPALAPFFSTRGYCLYDYGYPNSKPGTLAPSPLTSYEGFPWPRALWTSENELWFRSYHVSFIFVSEIWVLDDRLMDN